MTTLATQPHRHDAIAGATMHADGGLSASDGGRRLS